MTPGLLRTSTLRYRDEVTSTPRSSRDLLAPIPLKSRQVDITNRMGALTPATPTGIRGFDALVGGLRTGTVLLLSGAPGEGKTAFALFLAYMAARSGAAVLYSSASLDETEIVARLTARALHRDWPEANTPYGRIWSGQAWQTPHTRGPVGQAVESVIGKVGQRLHLHAAEALDPVEELHERVAELWRRYDRVLLVVDDLESFSSVSAAVGEDMSSRMARVGYALRNTAEQGCAVLATCLSQHVGGALPAASHGCELAAPEQRVPMPVNAPPDLGVRPLDLKLYKNRLGATGTVPLWFVAGAALFQERG
jgi:hypothetical protein